MTTLIELDGRVSALEHSFYNDLSVKVASMGLSMSRNYEETVANRKEIAGLRKDLTGFQNSVHTDMTDLRTTITVQGNEVRREMGVEAGSLRTGLTNFKDETRRSFDALDIRITAFRDEVRQQFTGMDEKFTGIDEKFAGIDEKFAGMDEKFTGIDEKFAGIDSKLETLIAEIRGSKN
jgi:hypothetical protein